MRAGLPAVPSPRNPTGAGISVASPLAGRAESTHAGTVNVPLLASPAMHVNAAATPAAGFSELPVISTRPEPLQVTVKSCDRSILVIASWPVQEAGLPGMLRVALNAPTSLPPEPLSIV